MNDSQPARPLADLAWRASTQSFFLGHRLARIMHSPGLGSP
jgi:hypothetical protein